MRFPTRHWGCLLGIGLIVWAADARAQSTTRYNPTGQVGPTISTGSQFGYNQELLSLQYSTRSRRAPNVGSVSRYTRGLAERALSTRQKGGKPFANVQRSPTLSPYLNLLRNDEVGGLPNYHTFVRPALEQQSTNRRTSSQIQGLNQQVEAVNRQLAFQPSEAGMVRPTGHQTVFMNHSHYYSFGP